MDPCGILYVNMYKYHNSAQVMVLDKGYRHCIYVGCEGELQRVQLLATDGHGILSYAYVQYWREPTVGSRRTHSGQGAKKAEG